MNNKTKIIAGGIALSVVMFFGGYEYSKSVNQPQTTKQIGAGMQGGQRSTRNGSIQGGGFTSGQILSADDKSLIISLKTGGSKIVFISPSTSIEKTISGTSTDLTTNTQVSVVGQSNPDGSITASSIQIRSQEQQNNRPKN